MINDNRLDRSDVSCDTFSSNDLMRSASRRTKYATSGVRQRENLELVLKMQSNNEKINIRQHKGAV